LQAAGLEVEQVAKVAEGGEATVVDLVRRGRCDLVINTPFGGSLQRTDGYRIREAALVARVPCITTISGAAAAVHAIANARRELALSLQEQHGRTQGSPMSPLLPASSVRVVGGAPAGQSPAPPAASPSSKRPK
jgi:carbamoyl-phosphate synthase large subunit